MDVIVKSTKYPQAEGLTLTKIGENQYKGTIIPTEEGFSRIMDKEYAVNYEQEYQDLGMNTDLEAIVATSGGKTFDPTQKDEIIEFVKSTSRRTRSERTTIVWPFILAAAVLFLVEILARKVREYRI